MANVEKILKNVREVSHSTRDQLKQTLITMNQTSKLSVTLSQADLVLLNQVIDSCFDNTFGNAENVLKRTVTQFVDEEVAKK